MSTERAFHGVIPAMAVPFRDDAKLDAEGLARFARWLVSCRDVMPCHMWLRFGVREDAVYQYVKALGAESGLDTVVHVYPANTRVSYSTRLMVRLAGLPQVKAFKLGERDLGKYERDIRALRADAPHVALLNCMDEYLFPTFVHRMDGTLVGCARARS
jgi:4-hydroxy-tetrahydrodipicolinate synthase